MAGLLSRIRDNNPDKASQRKREQLQANENNTLIFPGNLLDKFFVMSFYDYSRPGLAQDTRIPLGAIFLPVPSALEEGINLDVNSSAGLGRFGMSAESIVQATQEISSQLSSGGVSWSALASIAGSAYDNVLVKPWEFAVNNPAAAVQIALNSVGSAPGQVLSLYNGQAINPNIALIFNGVNLKQYTFRWVLIPESYEDSITLDKIKRQVKQYSLPRKSQITGGESTFSALLSYPKEVQIEFNGFNNDSMPLFKTAMITGISINYFGQGMNNAFEDGRPIVTEIAISFTEKEIHTAADYE